MGGVFVRKPVYDALMNGPENAIELFHGYTYSAIRWPARRRLATLDIYRDEELFDPRRRTGALLGGGACTR
jgi:beta-alanine--pyruvate transaminase